MEWLWAKEEELLATKSHPWLMLKVWLPWEGGKICTWHGTQALTKRKIVTFQGQQLWEHLLFAECMLNHLRDACITYNTLNVPLIVQELFPRQWQGHLPTCHNAMLAHSLSSSHWIVPQLWKGPKTRKWWLDTCICT